jgi:hypothetical protein
MIGVGEARESSQMLYVVDFYKNIEPSDVDKVLDLAEAVSSSQTNIYTKSLAGLTKSKGSGIDVRK